MNRARIREIKERIDSVYFDRGDAHDLLDALLEQERMTEQARKKGWWHGKQTPVKLPEWSDELSVEYLLELGAYADRVGLLPVEHVATLIQGLMQQYRYTAEAEHAAEELRVAWAKLANRDERDWPLSWMT